MLSLCGCQSPRLGCLLHCKLQGQTQQLRTPQRHIRPFYLAEVGTVPTHWHQAGAICRVGAMLLRMQRQRNESDGYGRALACLATCGHHDLDCMQYLT